MDGTKLPEKLYYRIGLDIGIASVGWAVLENDSNDEPKRILDLGVRLFEKAENPKNGDSLAQPRRMARTVRRRLRRRRHRLDRIRWLMQQEGLIDTEAFMERYHRPELPNVYELRCAALERKLTGEEFAQILFHIAKHRGFKSTRKAETESKENGAVLSAIKENKALMEEKGYRTVGEMLCRDEAFRRPCAWNEEGYLLTVRNTANDYRHTILRAMLVEEVKLIFARQRELGNEVASEAFEEKYLAIMESQRSFDQGPGKQPDGQDSPYAIHGFGDRVGKCTFEPEEMRAAKAAYTSQLFVALQKINHLRLVDKNGKTTELTEEERAAISRLLHKKAGVTYANIRKELGILPDYRFNTLNYSAKVKAKEDADVLGETEKAKFYSMDFYIEMRRRIGPCIDRLPEAEKAAFLDQVGTILTLYKNDDSRSEELKKLGMEAEEIENILAMSPTGFLHLSLKAIHRILPHLKKGMRYNDACAAAGYDFKGDEGGTKSKLLKGEEIRAVVDEIANPVVKRSVSQTIKVINAIVRKYGSPQAVNIELARDMARNYDDRKAMEKQMKERADGNEAVKKKIQELGKVSPTGQDILKYRLWLEQGEHCLYSGERIPLEKLFEPGYDIDHILPYSVTFDDSFRNKALVTSQENRQKGNRTPYEYFGNDERRWKQFEARVLGTIKDYRKQQKLLKTEFTDEEKKQFKDRNLNDTKYITTVVYNLIRRNLELEPYRREGHKKQVTALNGSVTAYLRKRWGIQALYEQKNRDIDTHHAVDAVVIACCTDGMIHKITRSSQAREMRYAKDTMFEDPETGEIFYRDHFNRDEWDEKFGVRISRPWDWFLDELHVRLGDDPIGFLQTHPDIDRELDYPEWMLCRKNRIVRPIFVSRMPNRKVTGAAHADTVRSPRHFKDDGIVLTRTALTDLKLNKEGEIEGYYNPESDSLLYAALKRQLVLYGNDAGKAFAEPFYKPRADGSPGPLVKKVKIQKKMSLGVDVNKGQGIAENGSMVRIDVFRENGKYYFVPIYTADVVKRVLPDKAATGGRPYSEWRVMEDRNFLFSLYSRDLIHVKSKKGVKTNLAAGGQILQKEIFAYFSVADISTASISGIAHDSSYKFRSLGIQSLELIEKCQVDILGEVSIVKSEVRMGF